MIFRIVIPQAFENMEEATIGAWLKAEGDEVRAGDALCELITEKTTFDLPAAAEGVLRRIVAPEKSIVPVGFIIGLIGDPAEVLPAVDAENAALQQTASEAGSTPTETLSVPAVRVEPPARSAATGAGSRIRATPAARRAARELDVALEDVAAAFPGKVIGEEDVMSFAAGRRA
ncbi:MAG TPA: biotin/lipoyl-containing protein [Abditibacteriaceae bacterium]|nr:biotin/lipoyl-containing protein [Abditibacteriaceae bacterium]